MGEVLNVINQDLQPVSSTTEFLKLVNNGLVCLTQRYPAQGRHLSARPEWLEARLTRLSDTLNLFGKQSVVRSRTTVIPNFNKDYEVFDSEHLEFEIVSSLTDISLYLSVKDKQLESEDQVLISANQRTSIRLLWVVDYSFSIAEVGQDQTREAELRRQKISQTEWIHYSPCIDIQDESFYELNSQLKTVFSGAGYGDPPSQMLRRTSRTHTIF